MRMRDAGKSARSPRIKAAAILTGIVLACRTVPVFFGGIWSDELFTLKLSSYSLGQITYLSRFDSHPPLHNYLLHGTMRLLEWLGPGFVSLPWLRLSSAIPAAALVILMAWWAGRAWGRWAGLTVGMTALLTPGLAFYACELRNYSLVILLVAGASLAHFRLLARPALRLSILYTLLALAAVMTHYQAVFIVIGHGLWTVAVLWRRRQREGIARRFPCLAPFLILAAILAGQAGLIREKQEIYYVSPEVTPVRAWELLGVLVYHYPAGPIDGESPRTGYGTMTSIAFSLYFALLGGMLTKSRWRRRLKQRAGWEGLAAYCLWMLAGYLVLTWTLTWLRVAVLFSGGRLAILALPFWVMLTGAALARIGQARARRWMRLTLVLALLPCAAFCLNRRMALRNDLAALAWTPSKAGTPDGPTDAASQVYYLSDPASAPWLRHAVRGVEIRSIEELLTDDTRLTAPLSILRVSATRRLRDDLENLVDAALTTVNTVSTRTVIPIATFPEFPSLTCHKIPAGAGERFRAHLRQLVHCWDLKNLRSDDALILGPHALEIGTTEGLTEVEDTTGAIYRWTRGTRVKLNWQAPPQPGKYACEIVFFRPEPWPRPAIRLEYWLPGQKSYKELIAGTEAVRIRGEITTTRPGEALSMQLLTDAYAGNSDGTARSLMFLQIRMARQAPPPTNQAFRYDGANDDNRL